RTVEGEQVRVAGGEQFGVGARRREQEQRDPGQRSGDDEQEALHRKPGAPGRKVQCTQSVPMFPSLLPIAVTWKGFGNWLVSRRKRSETSCEPPACSVSSSATCQLRTRCMVRTALSRLSKLWWMVPMESR